MGRGNDESWVIAGLGVWLGEQGVHKSGGGEEEEMGRGGTSCFDMYLRCLGDTKAEMLGCIYGSDPGIWMWDTWHR